MTPFRISFAALVLSAFSAVQASEITQFPLDAGSRPRAEVRAELGAGMHNAPATNELYDGSTAAHKAAPVSTRSREAVRREAALSRDAMDPVMRNDRIGGM